MTKTYTLRRPRRACIRERRPFAASASAKSQRCVSEVRARSRCGFTSRRCRERRAIGLLVRGSGPRHRRAHHASKTSTQNRSPYPCDPSPATREPDGTGIIARSAPRLPCATTRDRRRARHGCGDRLPPRFSMVPDASTAGILAGAGSASRMKAGRGAGACSSLLALRRNRNSRLEWSLYRRATAETSSCSPEPPPGSRASPPPSRTGACRPPRRDTGS